MTLLPSGLVETRNKNGEKREREGGREGGRESDFNKGRERVRRGVPCHPGACVCSQDEVNKVQG